MKSNLKKQELDLDRLLPEGANLPSFGIVYTKCAQPMLSFDEQPILFEGAGHIASGDYGSYKTSTVASWCVELAANRRGWCVVLAYESADIYNERIQLVNEEYGQVPILVYEPWGCPKLGDEESVREFANELRHFIEQASEAVGSESCVQLLVIDSVHRATGASGLSELGDDDMRALFEGGIYLLRDELFALDGEGCAWLLVHHDAKGGTEPRGHRRLTDDPAMRLHFDHRTNSPITTLQMRNSRYCAPIDKLRFRAEPRGGSFIMRFDGRAKDASRSETPSGPSKDVLQLVAYVRQKHDGVGRIRPLQRELNRNGRTSRGKVQRWLEEAIKYDLMTHVTGGPYLVKTKTSEVSQDVPEVSGTPKSKTTLLK